MLYVYHTNALEGNSMSLPQVKEFLQDKIFSLDVKERDYMEAIGAFDALTYARINLSEYTTPENSNEFKFTEDFINDLHYHFYRYIDRSNAGKYRKEDVLVNGHSCPTSEKLSVLMSDFVNWLNSEETRDLHPIRKAALAHYQLTWIHPYIDGNGRTARLLMNAILMLHNYPLIIMPNTIRDRYFSTLGTAHSDNCTDIIPFFQLISETIEENLKDLLGYRQQDRN